MESSDSEVNLTKGDESLVNILDDLLQDDNNVVSNESNLSEEVITLPNGRLKGNFCSELVFNLNKRKLTELEVSVLEKGLGFAPTPFAINEAKMRTDFENFARKMRCKWHFRNNLTENFSEVPAFRNKSKWKPSLEVVVSRLESELFALLPGTNYELNLIKAEWVAMKKLADDKSIIIKPADKGSGVVVWGREDYIAESRNHLEDADVYKDCSFDDNLLINLTEQSNRFFKDLNVRKFINHKELKYLLYDFKKSANLGKLYFLPKIHKRLENVPGRPVISNCGTHTEKVSEFLDHHLKSVMQAGKSYIRDSAHFI